MIAPAPVCAIAFALAIFAGTFPMSGQAVFKGAYPCVAAVKMHTFFKKFGWWAFNLQTYHFFYKTTASRQQK